MKTCISCNRNISAIKNSTSFKCPNCGKEMIVRCGKCRELAIKYRCPECNFEGP